MPSDDHTIELAAYVRGNHWRWAGVGAGEEGQRDTCASGSSWRA